MIAPLMTGGVSKQPAHLFRKTMINYDRRKEPEVERNNVTDPLPTRFSKGRGSTKGKIQKMNQSRTLKRMLRVVDDADSSVVDHRLAADGVTNIKRQLETRIFGFAGATREIQRCQQLVDAVVDGIQDKNDTLDRISVLLQESSDRSCQNESNTRFNLLAPREFHFVACCSKMHPNICCTRQHPRSLLRPTYGQRPFLYRPADF